MPTFNVLTDRWIPLETASLTAGSADPTGALTTYASYLELLSGERDALDLLHPRDDVKFFTRTLLSSLTQALFGADDIEALRERIATPLDRGDLEAAIAPLLQDFEAVGGPAFLQSGSKPPVVMDEGRKKKEKPAEPQTIRMLFGVTQGNNHNLFRAPCAYDALCPACFVPSLYGAQSYAPSGGAGYSPGISGSPPVLSLVSHPAGVRATVWSNVLAADAVARYHAVPEGETPWKNATDKQGDDKPVGFLEGLFWQPRTLASSWVGAGRCMLCGQHADALVEVVDFAPRRKAGDRSYRHPYTALLEYTDKNGKVERSKNYQFRGDRPAFTGVPELLGDLTEGATSKGVLGRRAPVVAQALEGFPEAATSLLVFQYLFDKGSIKGIYGSTFPVVRALAERNVLAPLKGAVTAADTTLKLLRNALKNASQGAVQLYLPDAESTFWTDAEEPFWRYADALQTQREGGADTYLLALRAIALELFSRHVEPIATVPRRLPQVVVAGARLRADLKKQLPLSTDPKPEDTPKKKPASGQAKKAKSAGEAQ